MPPTSEYLKENFPRLYGSNSTDYSYSKTWESCKNEALVNFDINTIITNTGMSKHYQDIHKMGKMKTNNSFPNTRYVDNVLKNHENLKAGNFKLLEVAVIENRTIHIGKPIKDVRMKPVNFNKISGTTKHDIVEVSQMIRNHCKNYLIPLKKFLNEFKQYGERTELQHTVYNVSFYIKRKMIHAELKLIADQKNNLKTFDVISFEDYPINRQEVKASVDDLNKNKKPTDCTENEVGDNSINAGKDNVIEENDNDMLTAGSPTVTIDVVREELMTGGPRSVTILGIDDDNSKSGSGFSNSVATLETMKGRKI